MPNNLEVKRYLQGRLAGLRQARYSWWTHWQEIANFFLPRRYRWFIAASQANRGSPINQHIIDSTGCFAARNLAAGLLSGKCSPHRQWFKLKIGNIDSSKTTPTSQWLAECERIMRLIFQQSNYYNSIAQFFADLVVFGTAVIIMYDEYENVVCFQNPCAGEYFVDLDGNYRPCILFREFTLTVYAVVQEFGYDNCSEAVQKAYSESNGSGRSNEIVICHSIEPNTDDKDFGVPKKFTYREFYWEQGATSAPQSSPTTEGFLRKSGFYEQPHAAVRWDIVSNDGYGRSPAMDGLGDQKQLQQESKRKAQAIDKMVNPPLVADSQLQSRPASLLPGGMTYVSGMAATGKPGIASIYDTKFPVNEITEDMNEVRDRLKKVFYNDLFQTASQFETRSNITAIEWDMRKSESMIMLGPVVERIDNEGLSVIVERVFAMAARHNLFPPPPPEIAGKDMNLQFISMLAQAQEAAAAASIERVLGLAGNISGIDPGIMDKIDTDYAIDKYSSLLNNDPRMMRTDEQVQAIRQNRAQQQQAQQQAEIAEKLAKGAQNLANTEVGAGKNALQLMTGAS
jgi:hypothetical protein